MPPTGRAAPAVDTERESSQVSNAARARWAVPWVMHGPEPDHGWAPPHPCAARVCRKACHHCWACPDASVITCVQRSFVRLPHPGPVRRAAAGPRAHLRRRAPLDAAWLAAAAKAAGSGWWPSSLPTRTVTSYLLGGLSMPGTVGAVSDISGADLVTSSRAADHLGRGNAQRRRRAAVRRATHPA